MGASRIAGDIGMRRATVWIMMKRVRAAMAADPAQEQFLRDVVDADEGYMDRNATPGSGLAAKIGRQKRQSRGPRNATFVVEFPKWLDRAVGFILRSPTA
jgi:hypothetical protein